VYDLAHVVGDVELRLGNAGEAYPGIGKDAVHVDGRLTLAGRLGPFGNPSSDSARTMVTPATSAALIAISLTREPRGFDGANALELTARRILESAGGRETVRVAV
jgi:DNA/RNA-binding domain of Phe-tRNA-synthetase-like protein